MHGGGLLVFTGNDLIITRQEYLEKSDLLEVICLELTISKRKWIIFSLYRPPEQNLSTFFSELYKCLDKAIRKYENIVLMGDININTENDKALGINNYQKL